MADPLTNSIAQMAPNFGLILIMFIPLVIVGIFVLLFVVSRFRAWAIVEYGYESKNDIRHFKVNYSKDHSFLIAAGIPFLDPKAGFPIPVSGSAIRMKGKPAYRFYSPEPGIFIPVTLALDRKVRVQMGEKDGEPDIREMPIADLLPKIGFEARQAFGESYAEAEKLFQSRNKFAAMLATWAPIIVFTVLMLVVIIMLGNLTSNLANGVTVQCVTDAAKAGATTATAPFFG